MTPFNLTRTLATLLVCAGLNAQAEEPKAGPNLRVALNIEAQPVREALQAFGEQTGMQVLFRSEGVKVDGVKVAPVSGEMEASEALSKMLVKTGLKYEFVNERTVRVAGVEEVAKAPGAMKPVSEGDSPKTPENTEPGTGKTRENSSKQTSNDNTANARDENEIEEIFVTAQKREERLQDVPISISVLRGEELDRSSVQGITEALNSVPGVAATEHYLGGGTQVTVRGVTASDPLFGGSSPIAYYVDSVPFGFVRSAIAPDANAYDMQRVEVLRGPQGTLYGASALNGVVRVLTEDADLHEFSFKARTSASSTNGGGENYRADAALNVPLIAEKLAARVVLGYEDLDGWIDRPNLGARDANDAEIRNLRLKVNAQPTEALTVGFSAWLSRADFGAPSTSADSRQNNAQFPEPLATDYDAYGLKLGYEFPAFSVTSVTSYIDYANGNDFDFSPLGLPVTLDTTLDSQIFAQEILLSSERSERWRWSLGGFFRDAEDRTLQVIPGLISDFTDVSESFAAYGELTRVFADGRIELTGGLRYFEDDVTMTGSEFNSAPIADRGKFDSVSPRLVVTWHPSEARSVYASFGKGFRSGVLQTPLLLLLAPNFPAAKPDTLKNYELGMKGRLLEGRVDYEAAVYYVDWRDVQQAITVGSLGAAAVINGESASGMGFDFSIATQPLDGLTLGLNFSGNDLQMDGEVFSADLQLFEPGDRLNRSPEYTIGTWGDYVFPLGAHGLTGRFSAAANYSSRQTTRSIFGGGVVFGVGDVTLIGRTAFSVESDRWSAGVFVNNVTDERGAPVRPAFGIDDWNARVRPRTLGLQLEYRFR